MARELAARQCLPCQGGVPPLAGEEITTLLEQLGGGWVAVDNHHLHKEYRFPDFAGALAFTNRVGAVAESQSHHPDIHLSWGKVTMDIWTHKINGLTVSDFILAAKADEVL